MTTRNRLTVYTAILVCLISGNYATRASDLQDSAISQNSDFAPAVTRQINTKRLIAMKETSLNGRAFAYKIFAEACKNQNDNVLVSPLSAFMALSMAANGASGETLNQMAKVLDFSPEKIEILNSKNKALLTALNGGKDVRLEVANAVYSDKQTPFKKEFIDLCKKLYDAEAHSSDFLDPETVKLINNWCNSKTHGKISKILDKLSSEEKMVLLNAIYFKGSWKEQFQKAATADDTFKTGSGAKKKVKMMHQQTRLKYLHGDKFNSVFLPYAGGRQGMYIFLPDNDSDLSSFMAKLKEENWQSWSKAYKYREVNISMPRFKIEFSKLLNQALKNMGMPVAFEKNKADFSKMISQPCWISRVLQKTYMDVNEEGTEAAAVTAVIMATESAMMNPDPVVEFKIDRPFVLAITDEASGEFLFLASVLDPSK